jgi:hypothetical protein
MTVPNWNAVGVLPPIRPTAPGHSRDRSPYPIDLVTLVDRFATSSERMTILDGLLQFRTALHQVGIVSGFQWLDGSFLEDVETRENRPPRDIDVVTFFELPAGQDLQTLIQRSGNLFDPIGLRTTYAVDAYFINLSLPTDEFLVRNVAYWYSMWSHRRDWNWKGFVQVDLAPTQDADVRDLLNNLQGVNSHE